MFPVANVHPAPNVGPEPKGLDAAAAAAVSGIAPAAPPPPDPYTDEQALLKFFTDCAKQCADRRTAFERVWWRLLLYLLGRQWIYYERGVNQWVDKRLQKWVPRPVTNKIAETLNTILSVFQSVSLGVNVRPNGGDTKAMVAADTANRYESPLRDDHDLSRVQDESDWWLVALGNVWWFTWWDYSGDSATKFVAWERCVACQKVHAPSAVKQAGDACPTCGSPILESAIDPTTQQPIGVSMSKGHGRTDVVSPLEVSFPPAYANPDDAPMVIRRRWRTKEYLQDRLPADQLAKIRWESMATERSLQLLRSLASLTEVGGMANTGVSGEPTETEGVQEAELWHKPCAKYPKGLCLRVIDATTDGDGILVSLPKEGVPGPLPYWAPDGKLIWPWLHTGYEKFGGRGWARSPLEHLIEKQNQLNQLDSLIQMIVQRTANPVWLEPKGSDVQKFTGEPGLVVKYNPLNAGGNVKPERIEGSNIPASLPRLREMILADLESLAGTYDIIKGQKPAGVQAFSAMQLLVERSQSRYGKVLEGRGITYRRWFRIALDMERAFGSDVRAYAIMGPNGNFLHQDFKKADLEGAIRVEVEDGSQMPKTALGTRAAIQQLQALGVIDPRNPETGYAILQKFGQTTLYPGLDAQVMGARRVTQAFEQWATSVEFIAQAPLPIAGPDGALVIDPQAGQPMTEAQPPMPSVPPPGQPKAWQNSEIYAAEFKKWASSDVMQDLMARRSEVEPYVSMMILAHEQILAAAQMAQQQTTDPNDKSRGKDGQGVGGGRAMANSQQESGKPGVSSNGSNAV